MDYQDKEARASGVEPSGEVRRRNVAATKPNDAVRTVEIDEKTKQKVCYLAPE